MDDDPFRPPVVPTRPLPHGRRVPAVVVFLLMLLGAMAGVFFFLLLL